MTTYREGQTVTFRQLHCRRWLTFTGLIVEVTKVDGEIAYRVSVDYRDGTLLALVRNKQVVA